MYNYRYLIDFDSSKIDKEPYDVIIIGSGIAGVYTALEIAPEYKVVILTKETLEISNSSLAQGGIAVSLDKKDSPELHFKDTLFAGAGLCDEESVWVLVNEAAANIEQLCDFGVNFDKKDHGQLALSREAAHSINRIIHAGDTTGKEVCDKLISVVKTKTNVSIHERAFAIDILTQSGKTVGVLSYDEDTGKHKIYQSKVVIIATGGYGQLYKYTTNPEVATGDGVCMAYRAGAELMDLEFIQFHPTVLYHPDNKNFLISEAVRGDGAILRNQAGERFMPKYHELGDLAPRDVVSRAIHAEMMKTGGTNVFLDCTAKERSYLEKRFPNIFKTCLSYGIDMSKEYIPVAPAEHYCMGGIKTDIYGRTNIEGLYACGEAACNGIHGANRLASNSLLEGLVFGHKISCEIASLLDKCSRAGDSVQINYKPNRSKDGKVDSNEIKTQLKKIMSEQAGIIRDKESLEHAEVFIEEKLKLVNGMSNDNLSDIELQNLLLLSRLVVLSALEREESRGAHYRKDFNAIDDVNWRKNIIRRKSHDPQI